jgi:hypothetical protein
MPTKPWHEKPLWEKVYMSGNRIYIHAGLIIGHLGVSPIEFFDKAKLLTDYDQLKYENAVLDMTIYSRREAPHLRYELHDQAKKTLWIILGPPPQHPDYRSWWEARLISVRLEAEAGRPLTFATEPPVPLEPPVDEKPVEEKPKRKIRKKVT